MSALFAATATAAAAAADEEPLDFCLYSFHTNAAYPHVDDEVIRRWSSSIRRRRRRRRVMKERETMIRNFPSSQTHTRSSTHTRTQERHSLHFSSSSMPLHRRPSLTPVHRLRFLQHVSPAAALTPCACLRAVPCLLVLRAKGLL